MANLQVPHPLISSYKGHLLPAIPIIEPVRYSETQNFMTWCASLSGCIPLEKTDKTSQERNVAG